MARLKVKQISDFTSSVQALIDNDSDQNASIIAQISEDLSTEVVATNGDVSSIDLEISTSKSSDVVLSNALSAEILATSTDVSSIDLVLGGVATGNTVGSLETRLSEEEVQNSSDHATLSGALSTEIAATNSEVTSIDVRLSTGESTDVVHTAAISTEKSRVDAILAGANANTDTFAEVVSYINSLESADSLDTVGDLASMETRFSNLESTDVVISNELSDEVSSIDVRLSAGDSTDVVLSNALSTEILATSTDVSSIDIRFSGVDSTDVVLSNALSTEIDATSGDVSSIDVRLSGADSGIASLETSLDGFAKEAFIQAITSDIVGGGSGTGSINGPDGALGLAGSVGNWSENGAGTITFDLNDPIEGANIAEYQQNLVSMTVNGLEVGHSFLRIGGATTVHLDSGSLFGGAALEADDVIEFKYIKD